MCSNSCPLRRANVRTAAMRTLGDSYLVTPLGTRGAGACRHARLPLCPPPGSTGGEPDGDAYRTAPRGATSTAATPLAYSTRSRPPCLQRSTPEPSASVETTWSTTSSSPPES